MYVCVTQSGNDPRTCLLHLYSPKEVDVILAAPLPWCLGSMSAPRAEKLSECLNNRGGQARTVARCVGC